MERICTHLLTHTHTKCTHASEWQDATDTILNAFQKYFFYIETQYSFSKKLFTILFEQILSSQGF